MNLPQVAHALANAVIQPRVDRLHDRLNFPTSSLQSARLSLIDTLPPAPNAPPRPISQISQDPLLLPLASTCLNALADNALRDRRQFGSKAGEDA